MTWDIDLPVRNVMRGEGGHLEKVFLTFWQAYPETLSGEPCFQPSSSWSFSDLCVVKKPSHDDFFWGAISGKHSINPFVGGTGQYFVLQNAFCLLCLSLWLLGKHLSFVITRCLDGNAWIALLKLLAISCITSAPGMPEHINTAYLVNYLRWSLWEGGGVKSSSWHLEPDSWSQEGLWKPLWPPPSDQSHPSSSWILLMKGSSQNVTAFRKGKPQLNRNISFLLTLIISLLCWLQ